MAEREQRLPPTEWWPAGVTGIAVRRVAVEDGLALRVLEAGPATGFPVVLLHGWGVSAYLWRHNMLPLAAAGYRVVAMDLPGCGQSDAPADAGRYTLARCSAMIVGLLDALGLERLALAGQSMGGKLAAHVAMREPHRVRTLALYGPVGFGQIPPWQMLAPLVPRVPDAFTVPRAMVEFVQRRVQGKLGWFSERDVDEYWAPTQYPAVVNAQLQMLREFDWGMWTREELARLTMPTHVVFGTRDRTVRPRRAAGIVAHLPNGTLTWIHDGGHVVMEEVPGRINAMLLDALARS